MLHRDAIRDEISDSGDEISESSRFLRDGRGARTSGFAMPALRAPRRSRIIHCKYFFSEHGLLPKHVGGLIFWIKIVTQLLNRYSTATGSRSQ